MIHIKKYIEQILRYVSDHMAIGLVLFLATTLRLYNISKSSLWFDELGQYIVATKDLQGLLNGVSQHLSPPLDYIIMHFFLKFTPHTEFFIRMPAMIFGIGSVFAIYMLGKRLFSTEISLISAFLLAISPFAIQYSQEARMYSSFLFFTLVSFYTFIIYTEYQKGFILWVLSTILLIYTHYFGFFVILVQFVYIVSIIILRTENISQKLYKLMLGFLLIFISYVFWICVFLSQTDGGTKILGHGMNDNWKNFLIDPIITFSGLINMSGSTLLLLPLLLLIIISIGILYGIRYNVKSILHLIIWIILPILISYLLTIIRGPFTTNRNFIFILPAFLLLLSLGLQGSSKLFHSFIRMGNVKWMTLLLVFLITTQILPNSFAQRNKEDWKGLGKYFTENVKSNDIIIIFGGTPSGHLDFYYKGNSTYLNVRTIQEFKKILENRHNKGCAWVFVSGHEWWIDQTKRETYNLLYKNGDRIDNVYSQNKDRGVYKIC